MLAPAVVLAAAVFAFAAVASEPLDNARALVTQGDVRNAIGVLEEAAKSTTGRTRAQLLNAMGWLHYTEGRGSPAETLYREALSEASKADDAPLVRKIRNNLGIYYFVAGRLNDAESAFAKSENEGSVLAKRYLKLIADQRRVSKVNQVISEGVMYRLRGQFTKAIEQYDRALSIDSANVKALEYRGYAYFRTGKYGKAETDLMRAHVLEGKRTNVIINLMKVYCKQGRDDALRSFVSSERAIIDAKADRISGDAELRRLCGSRMAALGLN